MLCSCSCPALFQVDTLSAFWAVCLLSTLAAFWALPACCLTERPALFQVDTLAAFWAVSAYKQLARPFKKNVKVVSILYPSTSQSFLYLHVIYHVWIFRRSFMCQLECYPSMAGWS